MDKPRAQPPSRLLPGLDRDLGIFVALLVARSVNALAVKTFFQPDEYFQSLEPAWQTAFGDGSGAWITWVRNVHSHSSSEMLTML